MHLDLVARVGGGESLRDLLDRERAGDEGARVDRAGRDQVHRGLAAIAFIFISVWNWTSRNTKPNAGLGIASFIYASFFTPY